MILTKNFTLGEMAFSATAIKVGLKNEAGPQVVERLKLLCKKILQPLRDTFGVIIVTSGFRDDRVNRLVGGEPNSQHRLGEAADIRPAAPGVSLGDLVAHIKEHLPFDQVILEYPPGGWVHVSYGPRNRREVLIKLPGQAYRPLSDGELAAWRKKC